MIDTFLEGAALGLIVSITIGPAFFAIIQTGIHRGFSAGFLMALGIAASDVVLIGICYLGAARLFDNPGNKLYIGLIGGILLIIFGVFTFTRKPEILLRRSSKYKTPKKPGWPAFFHISSARHTGRGTTAKIPPGCSVTEIHVICLGEATEMEIPAAARP